MFTYFSPPPPSSVSWERFVVWVCSRRLGSSLWCARCVPPLHTLPEGPQEAQHTVNPSLFTEQCVNMKSLVPGSGVSPALYLVARCKPGISSGYPSWRRPCRRSQPCGESKQGLINIYAWRLYMLAYISACTIQPMFIHWNHAFKKLVVEGRDCCSHKKLVVDQLRLLRFIMYDSGLWLFS